MATAKDDLKEIETGVKILTRKAQYKAIESERGKFFHATDFVNECSRNLFYSKIVPRGTMDTKTMTIFWVGIAIHKVTDISQDMKYHEMKMAYDYVDDKVIDIKDLPTIKPEKYFDIVVGSCDDLVQVLVAGNKEWCIVDKKTWRSKGFKKTSPSSSHIDQVNIYRLLLEKCQGIVVPYGAIVYFDMWQEGVEKPQVMPFKLDSPDITRGKMLKIRDEIMEAQKTGVLPRRYLHWKCDGFCPYSERCFNEEIVDKGLIKF